MTSRIFDTVMFNDEFEILECRLTELEDIPGLVTVAVECDVDHQDHRKPYHLSEQIERFDPWKDRLIVVRASGLPTAAEAPDPWAREHAQREWAAQGLIEGGCENDDVVLHGDCDEIPTVLAARNVRPRGYVAFEQRGHFWAVDWLYPQPWRGTVASVASNVKSFNSMRDSRNFAPALPSAGWHLSWLGGAARARKKLGAFCHPEAASQIDYGLRDGTNHFLEAGIHVDGLVMQPVDVDRSWPKYVYERRCPDNWFRPRQQEQVA